MWRRDGGEGSRWWEKHGAKEENGRLWRRLEGRSCKFACARPIAGCRLATPGAPGWSERGQLRLKAAYTAAGDTTDPAAATVAAAAAAEAYAGAARETLLSVVSS